MGPGSGVGAVANRYTSTEPPIVETGQYFRSQESDPELSVVSFVADTATQPVTSGSAAVVRSRAPGTSAHDVPRGPNHST